MKKILTIILIYLSLSFTSAFSEGWKEGYKSGYCYQVEGCLEPLVPLAPLPEAGFNTYKDGYNSGFIAGKKARD